MRASAAWEALDQRVDEEIVAQLDPKALQRLQEAGGVAGLQQVPQRGGRRRLDERAPGQRVVPFAPRRRFFQPEQRPGAALHRVAQRQQALAGRCQQQLGELAPALVEVAVVGAGADGRRLVGAGAEAVGEGLHRREAVVAHHRQHRPPAGALQPGLAADVGEAGLAV
ncbi:hypothetical protein, partial [Rubrivivax gelatinosus]|uniref:hypothetical protein n=1 Tax=Rubrivivax gelatinosus TaxID=28068 RepID=UPI0005C1D5E9